ncbi:Phosphoribosylformimino-5-aminoimidazole carboxamide ribotide isomerase [Syncephalis pseudoplumigaleata]|uniref:1-(5-phosphoribosyl)-5-[(5-phosphoribosylamino)methylideneamino] imidazole-4-carboxamide isomerase n=1 Tax=Syncephalis pseudoplumigaleata TaxID=1712513 RepID=A0A4P9YZ29_9FUNG|nr:Phosphoribosylformimino-5-aminoimidazole carboxamide ribotide isomerase [Syncephalis pseudoplumigaleata]|eukprot:RKP25366.1 Phosphoribosylformimino-5-aminoimidazole carboxamide ribotide isomerase [Syncephalis pseudoplumigaleata]
MTTATPRRHSRFRPCIDLHDGHVKQIVGGTLDDTNPNALRTNFVASESAAYYAQCYRQHSLTGGHVIQLGTGNEQAATEALAAWPGGLQLGGQVTIGNARRWLDRGASKVIVTSWLFPDGQFSMDRLRALSEDIGRDRLVVDLSCRRQGSTWMVAMDRWRRITDTEVNAETLHRLADYCSEFLIHAADVEGLCRGIDEALVQRLGEWTTIPTTYAGGANHISDLELVDHLSGGKVDLTFGSALDLFGGSTVKFADCIAWNQQHACSDGRDVA